MTPQDRLSALIGLAPVKDYVARLSAQVAFQNHQTLRMSPSHLIFIGNSNTGKTTAARLIGEIYRDLGLLQKGHLVEVRSSDLVGEFVGQSAFKTNAIIDMALDGVLKVDEPNALLNRAGFGIESLGILLSRMTNTDNRLVVIFSGPPHSIEQFLHANPGLDRLFPANRIIPFADYDADQLSEIRRFQSAQGNS